MTARGKAIFDQLVEYPLPTEGVRDYIFYFVPASDGYGKGARYFFNRFYRIGAEVRRSRPGTGLGLFIVRSVAKRHRGQITAESAGPERGSLFTLTLPGPVEEHVHG